jgi:hypothetical protein
MQRNFVAALSVLDLPQKQATTLRLIRVNAGVPQVTVAASPGMVGWLAMTPASFQAILWRRLLGPLVLCGRSINFFV